MSEFYKLDSLPPRPEQKEGLLLRLTANKQWEYYTPAGIVLSTTIADEVTRAQRWSALKKYFLITCRWTQEPDEAKGIIDRWIWTQHYIQPLSIDPLIPTEPVHDIRFASEMMRSLDFTEEKIVDIEAKLLAYCKKLLVTVPRPVNIISAAKLLGDLSLGHIEKLKKLYIGSNFDTDIKILLQRYNTLGGNAMQAAVPPKVMEYMRKYDVMGECFASPFNRHFTKFCSAFPDTDLRFGSQGSFFNFYPTEGFYEANPPFIEIVMSRMVEHMEKVLYLHPAVKFLVVVPKWSDDASPMWAQLTDSPYLQGYKDVPKKSHKYMKGYQHLKSQTGDWVSGHTTTLFILSGDKSFKDISVDFILDDIIKFWINV